MTTSLIQIDGSHGEGGGQILRTSLALSLVTGIPFDLSNIRAKRKKPGLQPQHLMCVRAAATIGQAETRGASRGSTVLHFEPGDVKPGSYHFPIGTAGATGLVLQTLYLPLALADAPSDLTIDGGTHVDFAPCFHFLDTTWGAYLEQLGIHVKLRMKRPGFYPRGGGQIRAHIEPAAKVKPWKGKPAKVTSATGISAVAGLPIAIAERQSKRARKRLKRRNIDVNIAEEEWQGGPGTLLAVTLNTLPAPTMFFGLGARGKPAERVADEAVDQAMAFLDADPMGVDPHSADQIVLPLALAEGESRFAVSEITPHLQTNIDVIRMFVERDIRLEGELCNPGSVTIAASIGS